MASIVRKVRDGFALAALVSASVCATAWGQQADVPGFRPGREGEAFKQPAQPRAGLELAVPEGGGGAAVPEAEQITLELTNVVVEGSTVYSPDEIAALYQDLLARRTVTLADVYRVAEAVTLKYREDGYVLSRAIVPAQRISGGVVRLQVVEGYIERLVIESEDIAADAELRRTLEAYLEKIKLSKPARIQDMERYLLLINDLAGVRGRAVIRPTPGGLGASELVLVTDHQVASGSATIENYSSRFVGQWQALGEASVNSLLGRGERFGLRLLSAIPADELRYVEGFATLPIGTEGLTLSLSGQFSRSHPGFRLEPFDIESDTWGLDVALAYPVVRSRAENLTAKGGYHRQVSETGIFATTPALDPYLEDDVHAAFANLTYDFVDGSGGVNLVGVTVTAGTQDSFLATGRAISPADSFAKLSGEMVRYQPLFEPVTLVLAGEWQYSDDVLVSSERFGAGGKSFGRGYDPSEILGDSGVSAKAELRYGGTTDWEWMPAYTVYGFYDFSAVWRNDVPADERQSLASVGLGVQAPLVEWLSGRLEVARPLTRIPAWRLNEDSDEQKAPRVYLSLTAQF